MGFVAFLQTILVAASMIGLFWSIVGVPAGIIVAVIRSGVTNEKEKKKWKKIMLWCFGGPALLIASFVLFFLLSLVLGLFGINPASVRLPQS